MQYLLLCCFDEKQWEALPETRRASIMHDYGEWLRSLDASGGHLSSAKLQPVSSAATVRARNGKSVVVDGPYAETKEQLGGYHLVECAGLEEAVEIAKRIPTLPWGGAVEVRPLEPGPACAAPEGVRSTA